MVNRRILKQKPFRSLGDIKLNDNDLFGKAAGESEDPKILDSYFIDLPKFDDFYRLENRLNIVRARKGMGKSTLISRLEYILENKVKKKEIKAVVIKVTGTELFGLDDFYGKNHLYSENYWKQLICRRISIEIGKQTDIALTDSQITFVEVAELEGYKSKNLVGSLTSRMKGEDKNCFC